MGMMAQVPRGTVRDSKCPAVPSSSAVAAPSKPPLASRGQAATSSRQGARLAVWPNALLLPGLTDSNMTPRTLAHRRSYVQWHHDHLARLNWHSRQLCAPPGRIGCERPGLSRLLETSSPTQRRACQHPCSVKVHVSGLTCLEAVWRMGPLGPGAGRKHGRRSACTA